MGRIKSEAGVGGVKRGPKSKTRHIFVKHGFDGPIEAPLRKTVTIFKQPVTLVVSSKMETKEAPADKLKKFANDTRERPMPLFWPKCFEQFTAMAPVHKCDYITKEYLDRPDEYVRMRPTLPDNVSSYCGIVKPEEAMISYVSALTRQTPLSLGVTGQKEPNSQKRFFDNPSSNADPDQPLVVGISKIQESDIAAQEQRVLDARKRLEKLRSSFEFRPSSPTE